MLAVIFPMSKVRGVFRLKGGFKPFNRLDYISLQPCDALRKRHVEWGQSKAVGRCLNAPAYF